MRSNVPQSRSSSRPSETPSSRPSNRNVTLKPGHLLVEAVDRRAPPPTVTSSTPSVAPAAARPGRLASARRGRCPAGWRRDGFRRAAARCGCRDDAGTRRVARASRARGRARPAARETSAAAGCLRAPSQPGAGARANHVLELGARLMQGVEVVRAGARRFSTRGLSSFWTSVESVRTCWSICFSTSARMRATSASYTRSARCRAPVTRVSLSSSSARASRIALPSGSRLRAANRAAARCSLPRGRARNRQARRASRARARRMLRRSRYLTGSV